MIVRFQNGVWRLGGRWALVGKLFAIPGLLANGFEPSDIVCDASGKYDSRTPLELTTRGRPSRGSSRKVVRHVLSRSLNALVLVFCVMIRCSDFPLCEELLVRHVTPVFCFRDGIVTSFAVDYLLEA